MDCVESVCGVFRGQGGMQTAFKKARSVIRVGTILSTSYGTGPYRVVSAIWDRCDDQLDVIEFGEPYPETNPGCDFEVQFPRPTHPHVHLVCVHADSDRYDSRRPHFLNGYRLVDGVWRCIWKPDDYLIIHGLDGQLKLFE